MFFLDEQVVTWTDKFKYLVVHFICGNRIDIDIIPINAKNFSV